MRVTSSSPGAARLPSGKLAALHAAAKANVDQLLTDANAQVAQAEERVVDAIARAESIASSSEANAARTLQTARERADRIVVEANEHAEATVGRAAVEAQRRIDAIAGEVAELERQRDGITAYLDELRGLLGGAGLPSSQLLAKAEDAEKAHLHTTAGRGASGAAADAGRAEPVETEVTGAEPVETEVTETDAEDATPAEADAASEEDDAEAPAQEAVTDAAPAAEDDTQVLDVEIVEESKAPAKPARASARR
ncbi:hypothetical protein [Salana multivorans]